MIKSTKIYFGVIAFIMIIFVVFGFFVKNSRKGEKDFNSLLKKIDLDNIVVYDMEDINQHFDNDISDLSALESKSDLIAKVKVDSNFERKLYLESVKTRLKVLEVYKENKNVSKDDYIYIHETLNMPYFSPIDNIYGQNMNCLQGYLFLKEDKEYIVFLKHLLKHENYNYSKEESITFIPVSTRYFNYGEQLPVLVDEKAIYEGKILYKEVKNNIAFFTNKNLFERYFDIKKEVEKKYS